VSRAPRLLPPLQVRCALAAAAAAERLARAAAAAGRVATATATPLDSDRPVMTSARSATRAALVSS